MKVKKFIALLLAAVIAAMTLGLTGCFLLPKYNDPTSMEINGETYVSGFYDNLWPVGITVAADESPAFESKYHKWWKVKNAPFDMYCAQNNEALYWKPAIYCKESEFEEVKAYYADTANYDYYIGGWETGTPQIELTDESDKSYAERAICFRREVTGGISDSFNDSLVTVEVDIDLLNWQRGAIYRVSRDDFFTTSREEWAVLSDGVYFFYEYDDTCGTATFYSLEADVSAYLAALFEKYLPG